MPDRDLVFFSYRHDKDGERWLSALHGMLEPYVLGQHLVAWSDRDIRTGEQWHGRIQGALDRTKVAVLLVNQRFFGSTYICQHELPRLLSDAQAGHLQLVVVLIGNVDPELLKAHRLDAYQAANDPKKPLNELPVSRRDRALVAVAMNVRRLYGSATEAVPAATASSTVRQGDASAVPGPDARSPLGPLLDVPPYNPARYVARPDDLSALRAHLVEGTDLALGLTSAAPGFGLHGMGGMGKSVLAQALCHDEALRRAFPDGVAWVALGQSPDLLGSINRVLRLFDDQAQAAESAAEGSQRLRASLQGRRVLIVIDDIWDADHFRPFDVAQGHCRVLLTTRDSTVLREVGARSHALKRLPQALARDLLALRAGCAVDRLPAEADDVIQQTAGLPLALALAGSQVADGVAWTTVRDELVQGHIDFLDHAYASVYSTLGRSVDALPGAERQRYQELAVFPEDSAVPFAVIARLWRHCGGLTPAQTEKLLTGLDRKSLLTVAGSGDGRTVALHDLQLDFLRLRAVDPTALHLALVNAYRAGRPALAGPAVWAHLPRDEPYIWPHLARHLMAAGLDAELEACLLDLDWIGARLAAATRDVAGRPVADVVTLIQDYAWAAPESPARAVQRALRASAHRLARHPGGLAQHLHGRLGHMTGDALSQLARRSLLQVASQAHLLPTRPGLAPPGAQEGTLVGHESSVSAALLLPDGRRALSWSHDNTLRVWDLDAASEPRVLAGHESSVSGALLLPDGRRALSWSADGTVRLWNLQGAVELDRYEADAAITTVIASANPVRFFVGDSLGHVQILQLKP